MPVEAHPFINFLLSLIVSESCRFLEPLHGFTGRQAGIHLDRSSVHCQGMHAAHSHIHTLGQFGVLISLKCMFWGCGKKYES